MNKFMTKKDKLEDENIEMKAFIKRICYIVKTIEKEDQPDSYDHGHLEWILEYANNRGWDY